MEQETISDLILRLKRDTNKVTINPLLDAIELEKIKLFEAESQTNADYRRKLNTISENLRKVDYIFTPKYQRAFDAYNEIAVYELLKTRVDLKFMKEGDVSTPDFKITYDGIELYADLKTLHYVDGNLNYIDIQEQAAIQNIKLDKQKKENKFVVISDGVSMSPFKKGNTESHRNINVIIERLIDKGTNLLKLSQVNYHDTSGIYILDTSQIFIPNMLEMGLPVHEGVLYKELNSGILWNAVFGKIGDPTYNWIEFEGLPNIGGRLQKNGLLVDTQFDALRAIAFIIGDNEDKKIVSFHRSVDEDKDVLSILYKISDFVNDELNSQYWRLKNN